MLNNSHTILILDDEHGVRESFVDYFSDCGYHTFSAETAEVALELIAVNQIEAALVDIRLPGIDGNSFIRKAFIISPQTAFIVVTGSSEYVLPEDLLENPKVSNKVFNKPVENLKLLEESLRFMIK